MRPAVGQDSAPLENLDVQGDLLRCPYTRAGSSSWLGVHFVAMSKILSLHFSHSDILILQQMMSAASDVQASDNRAHRIPWHGLIRLWSFL